AAGAPVAKGAHATPLRRTGIETARADDTRGLVKPHEVTERRHFEELVRERMDRLIVSLEGQVAEVLKFGQALVVGILSLLVQLVIVLLVAAYLLIDLDKIHAFVRSVFPERYRN